MCKGMCNHSVQNGYDTKGSAHRNISEAFYIYIMMNLYTHVLDSCIEVSVCTTLLQNPILSALNQKCDTYESGRLVLLKTEVRIRASDLSVSNSSSSSQSSPRTVDIEQSAKITTMPPNSVYPQRFDSILLLEQEVGSYVSVVKYLIKQ